MNTIPMSVRFFMWSLKWNSILTVDRLQRRGLCIPNRCSLCKVAEETKDHLFLKCRFSRGIWKELLSVKGEVRYALNSWVTVREICDNWKEFNSNGIAHWLWEVSTADFISLHMPLTPTTNKVLNDESFAKMKKKVRIVNVARGGVIDEDALVRALDAGRVSQATLDVFTKEPPASDSKLIQHENVTVTPHLCASTREAQEGVAIEIAEAVVGALKGELSATAVNVTMVSAEVLSELAAYVILAEKLGRLVVQLVGGGSGVKTVKVTYASARATDDLDTRVLRAMITKGLIEPVSSAFVNLVNADFTAKQRGIRIAEERILLDGSPENPK